MTTPDLPLTTFAINECEESFVRDFCPYRGNPDPLVVWRAAWAACAAAAVLAERERPVPVWPRRCELTETDIGRAYSNGWNECLSDCIRAFAAALQRRYDALMMECCPDAMDDAAKEMRGKR